MSIFKKLVVAVLAVTLVFSLVGCGSNTVAVVNGEKITKEHFDIRVKKTKEQYESQGMPFTGKEGDKALKAIEQQVLDQMIEETLIKQEAEKQGVLASEAAIKERVAEIKKSFPNEEEFKKVLKGYNMDEKDLGEWIGTQMTQEALFAKITSKATVSDKEVKEYFEVNKDKFNKVTVRHILIQFKNAANPQSTASRTEEEAKKEIDKILADVKAGKNFKQLAKEKSEDPAVAQNEGEYTFSKEEQYSQAFKDAAFALKNVGDISEPVKTEFGFHILKLEKKVPATYETAKAQIQEQLVGQEKQNMTKDFVAKLKSEGKIEKKLAK